MRTALPQLADAVASIIRQSSNPQFQQRCQEILQVARNTSPVIKIVLILPTQTENRQKSEKDCVADRLWEMAEEKLHVSKTHTKPAQVSQLHALILHGVLVTGRNLLPLSWSKH